MEKNKVIVDANIFIAFYLDNDSLHEEGVEMLRKIQEEKYEMLIHPFVIQEVVTILTYREGSKKAKVFLDDIFKTDCEIISIDKKIAFADVALLATSKEYNLPIITFDKQLASLQKKM
jgi:predicted nucleic acid-binding protein